METVKIPEAKQVIRKAIVANVEATTEIIGTESAIFCYKNEFLVLQ